MATPVHLPHITVSELIQTIEHRMHTQAPVAVKSRRGVTLVEVSPNSRLRLPLCLPVIDTDSPAALLDQLQNATQTYTILLLQAGYAAIGFVEHGTLMRHKMIKKYMVRRSQGKSQLKHLKSKGKSRAGSRIRLKNTIAFFEEINQLLIDWDINPWSETILMSLPINMKNLFFNANVPPPFDRSDPRIKKIPLDIKVPSFKELKHVHWVASRTSPG